MNDQRHLRIKIAREIAQFAATPRLQPDETTISIYAEAEGLSHGAATTELENALKAGTLTRRKVKHNGKWQWAYKLKPQGDSNAE